MLAQDLKVQSSAPYYSHPVDFVPLSVQNATKAEINLDGATDKWILGISLATFDISFYCEDGVMD